jgi:hypothetical protein
MFTEVKHKLTLKCVPTAKRAREREGAGSADGDVEADALSAYGTYRTASIFTRVSPQKAGFCTATCRALVFHPENGADIFLRNFRSITD